MENRTSTVLRLLLIPIAMALTEVSHRTREVPPLPPDCISYCEREHGLMCSADHLNDGKCICVECKTPKIFKGVSLTSSIPANFHVRRSPS
ncbi:hypothetical protein AB6A40_006035 [Gnathostoma spinigerum]|uniref:Uncharacterized protein n=1 Tax=Gnathostoma spinigerum TaxID=75299 RepID=A0ABD6EHW3_9BILA